MEKNRQLEYDELVTDHGKEYPNSPKTLIDLLYGGREGYLKKKDEDLHPIVPYLLEFDRSMGQPDKIRDLAEKVGIYIEDDEMEIDTYVWNRLDHYVRLLVVRESSLTQHAGIVHNIINYWKVDFEENIKCLIEPDPKDLNFLYSNRLGYLLTLRDQIR